MEEHSGAIILVHGIGDFKPGSALAPALAQISKSYPSVDISDSAQSTSELQRQILRARQTKLELIEFHWSGVAGKIRTVNPFKAFLHLLNLFWDLPRICLWQSASRYLAVVSNATAIFFVSAAVIHVVFIALFLLNRSLVNEPSADQSTALIDSLHPVTVALGYTWAVQQLLCFILISAAAISAVALRVAARRSNWFEFSTGTVAAALVYAVYFVLVAVTLLTVYGILETLTEGAAAGLAPLLVFGAIGLTLFALLVIVPQMAIADLFRDVVHYFAPSLDRQDHPHTRETKNRLHNLLVELASGGAGRIVIVAHSLGTVITTEVLRDFTNSKSSVPLQIDLVTCGSPLKRLLPGLLPRRVPPVRLIFEQMRSRQRWTLGGWMNVYRVLDYVGQAIGGRSLPMDRPTDIVDALNDDIVDVRLSPWYRPGYSHANYWQDSRLVHLLMATVLQPLLPYEHHRGTVPNQEMK